MSPIDRRDFLKLGLAATATAAVGVGMSRIPLPMAAPAAAVRAGDTEPEVIRADDAAEQPRADHDQPSPHHWAMVIDQGKCVGCDLCLAACHAYNDTPPNISWSRVEEVE
ncbi:MAG TPA: twin-arginine translocation signal domain-containing protein, partial [Promineifilum sp.]|nr:twin-arginine translocation signal domain-containing protein [Promineifilum sp.]